MKLDEFWSRLSIPSAEACWEWTGGKTRKQFPVVNLGGGVFDRPHRIAYRIHYGEPERQVRHTCANSRCANPAHLRQDPIYKRPEPTGASRRRNAIDFWANVDRSGPDECWHWKGARHSHGYGLFEGRYAHRRSWEEANGRPPGSLEVCHRCDNPPCVNPEHLFLGTHAENMADHSRKMRSGRLLTPEQVREVRRLWRPWCRTNGGGALGRRFGVSLSVINDIVHGKTCRHDEPAEVRP